MGYADHLMRADAQLVRINEHWAKRYAKRQARPISEAMTGLWSAMRVIEPESLEALQLAWSEFIPPSLREHTRLDGLRRGILTVTVDSAAHHQELDVYVRSSGLVRQLSQCWKARPINQIRLILRSL